MNFVAIVLAIAIQSACALFMLYHAVKYTGLAMNADPDVKSDPRYKGIVSSIIFIWVMAVVVCCSVGYVVYEFM